MTRGAGERPSEAAGGRAIWCTELELSGPRLAALQCPEGDAFDEVRCLLRLHGEPLGYVSARLTDGGIGTTELVAAAPALVLAAAQQHLLDEGLPPVSGLSAPLPSAADSCPNRLAGGEDLVTVVVCSRNRPQDLARCLDGLVQLQWARLEIVVVDNAPADDATRRAVEQVASRDARVRYVVEPRPGLSVARNRGLSAARGSYIVYTDDDVRVDPAWISGIVRGFRSRADVACVTGLVCTASLLTPAEHYFDARVSWADSCSRRIFDMSAEYDDGLYPYSPGRFGTGANFAFRTDVLRALGGFDEALGAGSRSRGGEDLDIFVRVLLAGHALAYEPAAVVWHHHRSEMRELERQMYAYGTGLSAFLAKHALDGQTRTQLLKRVPRGLARMARIPGATKSSLGETDIDSRAMLVRELAGCAAGPFYYLGARRTLPRQRRPAARADLAES